VAVVIYGLKEEDQLTALYVRVWAPVRPPGPIVVWRAYSSTWYRFKLMCYKI
jgi:hypothetical protein